MDAAALLGLDRPGLVHRLADDVHDAAQRLLADRHRDRLAGVDHLLAAHQALGGVHGDGAHGVLAQMLGDLEHQAVAVVVGLERVHDLGQMALELHVDHGARDLADAPDGAAGGGAAGPVLGLLRRPSWRGSSRLLWPLSSSFTLPGGCPNLPQSASAPEMISISSLVIMAWRVRL
jgi:hypothetical protein